MNLTRALDVALPDIPARTIAERYPRLDPGTTFREHVEDGKTIVRVYVPSCNCMFRFPPQQWKLAQLYDGVRTYEEIAELYSQQNGVQYDVQEVREFGFELDAIEFWYKTPQEKNILLMQQTVAERRKKIQQRSRWADLSMVTFPAFNPDKFLTRLYSHTRFVYTAWFTMLTIAGFAVTTAITVTHWSEIGRDTIEFYSFTNKTWADIVVMYALILAIVVIHEFAHAYVSKHFGCRVTAMGFALVYLTPALYTDTTESEALNTRSERFVVTIAGVWSELMICSVATVVWWGTAPDTVTHNGAYFIMMCTGFVSVLVNWNPLIKLDGYHMLCDTIGITGLKEDSTAFVSAWVKKHIWRLPVEVPCVPRSRRLGYAVYALLSGAYSYMVLYVVARFAGNVVRSFSPEWGFIPELAVAGLIFRSRIRLLGNFMKFVYLDKKDRIAEWFDLRHSLTLAAAAILFLCLPIRHDSVSGRFVLEPSESAVIRARVPGTVTQLFVSEGQSVAVGQALGNLRNYRVESEYDRARTQFKLASERANAASLHYAEYGQALKNREQLSTQSVLLSEKNNELQLKSPIAGVVITPRVSDMTGTYVVDGTEVLEVARISELRARIYVSEYDMHDVRRDAKAKLQVQGTFKVWSAQIGSIATESTEMDTSRNGKAELKGLNPPRFYLVNLLVENTDWELRPGMTGVAKIYGDRRSVAGLGWKAIADFWGRKLW